jgi:ParB family transcriptional regulator, chromosome partitioning protein
VALLDMQVLAKLGRKANALMEAEGWKWGASLPELPPQPWAAPDLSAAG